MNSPKRNSKVPNCLRYWNSPNFLLLWFLSKIFSSQPIFLASNRVGCWSALPSPIPPGRVHLPTAGAPTFFTTFFSQRKTESFRTWNLMFLYCTFAGNKRHGQPQSPTVDGFFTGKHHLRLVGNIPWFFPMGFLHHPRWWVFFSLFFAGGTGGEPWKPSD